MKLLTKASTACGLAMVSVLGTNVALADTAADIAAAEAAGKANVGLVVTAVIGVAALMFGLGYILRGLSK